MFNVISKRRSLSSDHDIKAWSSFIREKFLIYRFARLLLVFSLVLPNLVWAKVAVVNVNGVVVLGMNEGTGDGDPLNELGRDVGDGADGGEFKWFKLLPGAAVWGGWDADVGTEDGWVAPENGVIDFGERLRLLKLQPTDSMGLKHWASGLKVLVTSRSAEFSSWGSPLSLKRTWNFIDNHENSNEKISHGGNRPIS